MMVGTLSRYFGLRFLLVVIGIFFGMLALVAMVDFVEMLRRSAHMKDVSALFVGKITLYRVPFLTERILPFAVNTAAMFCYLNLSRRLELIVARSAGVSAWQFITPAMLIAFMIGVAATTLYNPISASMREESARLAFRMIRSKQPLKPESILIPPKLIARVGHAAWHAVMTSPSRICRFSFSAVRRARLMRWTQ